MTHLASANDAGSDKKVSLNVILRPVFGGKVSEKNIGKTTCVLSMEHCNISAIFEHVTVKCSFHVIFRGR